MCSFCSTAGNLHVTVPHRRVSGKCCDGTGANGGDWTVPQGHQDPPPHPGLSTGSDAAGPAGEESECGKGPRLLSCPSTVLTPDFPGVHTRGWRSTSKARLPLIGTQLATHPQITWALVLQGPRRAVVPTHVRPKPETLPRPSSGLQVPS